MRLVRHSGTQQRRPDDDFDAALEYRRRSQARRHSKPPRMPVKTVYAQVTSYVTKDGSEIRELIQADSKGKFRQSLAEALVQPGEQTAPHKHVKSEELYHFLAGEGSMTLAGNTFPVAVGDTVRIPPGTAHCVRNSGRIPLRFLCACVPPYSHDDTILL